MNMHLLGLCLHTTHQKYLSQTCAIDTKVGNVNLDVIFCSQPDFDEKMRRQHIFCCRTKLNAGGGGYDPTKRGSYYRWGCNMKHAALLPLKNGFATCKKGDKITWSGCKHGLSLGCGWLYNCDHIQNIDIISEPN